MAVNEVIIVACPMKPYDLFKMNMPLLISRCCTYALFTAYRHGYPTAISFYIVVAFAASRRGAFVDVCEI